MKTKSLDTGIPSENCAIENKMKNRLSFALLCDFHPGVASTIIDHIEGIVKFSLHKITIINFRKDLPENIDLNCFDGIILHYSLIACNDNYLSPLTRLKIRNHTGLKLAFIQDEYRFIDDTVEALRALRIDLLFTVVPEKVVDILYPPHKLPHMTKEIVLTGYVPEHLLGLDTPKFEKRPIDVGYRARKLPGWLGSFSQQKWIIADKFKDDAVKYKLSTDISYLESDRIYGAKWIEFLGHCKAVLGTESGSGVCDFTGQIQTEVENHIAKDPEVSFDELKERYFKEDDGKYMINVISPRCFEAAALRTLMILYEGDYSGRLKAWRHYVPLRHDHSNMDEVVAILRDPVKANEIIERAYHEVACNPENWFKSMVAQMDRAIGETLKPEMLIERKKPISFLETIEVNNQRHAKKQSIFHLMLVKSIIFLDNILLLAPNEKRLFIRNHIKNFYHTAINMVNRYKNTIRFMISFLPFVKSMPSSFARIRKSLDLTAFIEFLLLLENIKALSNTKDISIDFFYNREKRSLTIGITETDGQSCMEEWGQKLSPDDFSLLCSAGSIDDLLWDSPFLCGIGKTLPYCGHRNFPALARSTKGMTKAVATDFVKILSETRFRRTSSVTGI